MRGLDGIIDLMDMSLSKITADGDCSHEIKRRLLLGRKVMTNLDSILKSKDSTLPTKVRLVKAMVFPVVMYGEGNGTPLQYSCLENPWTEEPGGLQCKVMPNVDPWRRQWHPTPVLLPGKIPWMEEPGRL